MTARLPKHLTLAAMMIFAVCIAAASAKTYEEAESSVVPWSGYWWPYSEGGLATGVDYRGKPAPIDKYELLTEGGYPGLLSSWYRKRYYDPSAPYWHGLCAYWARASCFERIEILPSSEENIVFRVGDKKGLLTLAHDNDMVERANGFEPEIFHFWLLRYLKDRQRAFVADLDISEEVWSYPIYRYEMERERKGGTESVKVRIYFADDGVFPDYMGTQALNSTYTYDLHYDDENNIVDGQWTGASVDDHPQQLTFPLMAGAASPYLDYAEVERLATSRDDELEAGGNPVSLAPGTYNLILLDDDVYTIDCRKGDTVFLFLEKQKGSAEAIDYTIRNGNGIPVESGVIERFEPLSWKIQASSPPYTLSLSQNRYDDPNIYTMTFDVIRRHNVVIPYVPKNGWSGFTFTNPGDDTATSVTLAAYTEAGEPLQTIFGPFELLPGEKKGALMFDQLGWRPYEYALIKTLVLGSDQPVEIVNLFGDARQMACLTQSELRGGHLVIPDLLPSGMTDMGTVGGVVNERLEETSLSLRAFSESGQLMMETSAAIGARVNVPIQPGSNPFHTVYSPGWIEVAGGDGSALSGFGLLKSSTGLTSLPALPVNRYAKIVPHIPGDRWTSAVTLINPGDAANQVRFHLGRAGLSDAEDLIVDLGPREKKTMELRGVFGRNAADPLHRSILEIKGEHPVVGYYTYRPVDNEDDAVSMPLLDQGDFKNALVLPHYPNGGQWWTGVGIFNPGDSDVTVRIDPYDMDGNYMASQVKTIPLSKGAYDIFEVGSTFGGISTEISFLKFTALGASEVIGGFYIYGGTGNSLLSGANM